MTAPGGLAIIETHVDLLHLCRPAAALYPGGELGQDVTNWWGPNPAGVLALCRMAGFASAEPYGTIPPAPARTSRRSCPSASSCTLVPLREPSPTYQPSRSNTTLVGATRPV